MNSATTTGTGASRTRRWFTRVRLLPAMAVVMAGLVAPVAASVVGTTGVATPIAAAASNLSCASGEEYVLANTGDFYEVSDTTGDSTASAASFGSGSFNAFAIGPGGATAWSAGMDASSTGTDTVSVWTASSGTVATHTESGMVDSQEIIAGGIDPLNGIYYFAGFSNSGDSNATLDIYAMTATGTSLGEVATLLTGTDASTGDLAFSSTGQLYDLAGSTTAGDSTIYSVTTAIPTTAQATPVVLANTVYVRLTTGSDYYGLAVDPNGDLYALDSDTPSLVPVNSDTLTVGTAIAISGDADVDNLYDSASCGNAGSLSVEKSITSRAVSTDQFALALEQGSTSVASGTTTGSSTGLQAASGEVAGPVVGIVGDAYTVSEAAAAGANLANYASSYSCIDAASTTTSATSHNIATGSDTFTVGALGTLAVGQTVTVYDSANNADYVTGPITAVNTSTPSITVNVTSDAGSGTGITTWILLNNKSVASGTGTSATFNFPAIDTSVAGLPIGAAVTCVFTNAAALTIAKSVSPATVSAAATVITSTFTVTNTGAVAMAGVGVADTQTVGTGTAPAAPTCTGLTNPTATCSGTSVSLAAGQTATFTTTYTTTQADINAGTALADSATASGTPSGGTKITTVAVTASSTVTQTVGLTISKTATPASVSAAGTVITSTFTVTNSGNLTLTSVGVTDTQTVGTGTLGTPACVTLIPAASCSGNAVTLTPGEKAEFTATYTVTQADLNAGTTLSDSATAKGTEPSATVYTTPTPATATNTVTQTKGLTITKTVTPGSTSAAGQVLTSTFTVTNSGNVTLTSVGVADTQTNGTGTLSTPVCVTLIPAASCSGDAVTLTPGEAAEFTATYTTTQADLNNGTALTDSATASGTPPTGSAFTTTAATGSVTVVQNKSLTILKTASPTTVATLGQVITYTFTVTNNGNVTMTGVNVTDTQDAPAGTLASGPTCDELTTPSGSCSGSSTTLAPGQVAIFTATYDVTQPDLNAGSITDSATATGTPPQGSPYTTPTPSIVIVSVTQTKALTIAKSVSPGSVSAVGQVITSTFTVTNTGNVTLTSVGVNDTQTNGTGTLSTPACATLIPAASCSGNAVILTPGQAAVFDATYTVTQADLTNGTALTDSATASGTPPTGSAFSTTAATGSVTVVQIKSLTLQKTATPAAVSVVGQVVTSTFTVTNAGNVPLTAVTVTDTQTTGTGVLSAPACSTLITPTATCTGNSVALAPGQAAILFATYTVTQADLTNGASIGDSATATGTPPQGSSFSTTAATASESVTQIKTLTIQKTVSPANVDAVGQAITSTFTVTNGGNVPLTAVSVADTQTNGTGALSAPACSTLLTPTASCSGNAVTLAPGQAAILYATYTVTQADLSNGTALTDSATATGTPPQGSSFTTTAATGSVGVTQIKTLTLSKSTSPGSVSAVGQVITSTFSVTNSGNVPLTAVSTSDTQTNGTGVLTTPACSTLFTPTATCAGDSFTLAPGQGALLTATYTVTQADLTNGTALADSATATATPPEGSPFSTPPVTASSSVTQNESLLISKQVNPASVSAAGSVITSTFTVTNTGNVPLTSVGVTDTQTHGNGTLATPACSTLLTPTASCAGDSVSLAPGQGAILYATYTVTQADIDNGANLTDSATATATPPQGGPFTTTPATGSVTVTQTPGLTIVKSASPAIVTALNSVIDYTFTVTNTGYVTLSDVYVSDTQSAPAGTLTSGPTCDVLSSPSAACTTGSSTTLAPDQVAVFTATYTVTQPDLNAGSIHDSATATGTEPDTNTYTTPTPGTATVTATAEPGLTIAKSVSPASVSAAGQVITSTFTVTNTGNVTLSSVGVTDTQTHGTGTLATPDCTTLTTPSGSCSGATTSLAPDQVGIFTTTYTVNQADIDNGANLTDSATATGTEPSTNTYTTPTPGLGSVTVTQTPGLTIVKSASPAIVTALNSVIDYTFTVTNTGYVTLSDVYVSDTQSAPAGTLTSGPTCDVLSSPSAACTTGSSTTLAPDQVAVFTATYTVTQPDLNAGSIHDSATATGTEPDTNTYTTPTPGTATVTATAEPGLTIAKSVSPASVSAAGQVITSTFTVTNTGNVTLSSVGVTDTQTHGTGTLATPDCTTLTTPSGSCSGATTSLAPDQVGIFTTTYTVNQADIDNGANLTDSATATGTEPSTNTYTTPTPGLGSVTVTQTPGLTIAKSVSPASVYEAEQVITSTFTVTNTGNVDLTGVGVTDTQTNGSSTPGTPDCTTLTTPSGSCSGATTTLAPDQVGIFTTTYTVTQADINGGTNLTDSATATGTEPSTNTYTTPTPGLGSVTVTQTPSLTIVKSASPAIVTALNSVIDYTFTVTNTGYVTLSDVYVSDTQSAPAGTLTSGPTCDVLSSPSAACTTGSSTTLAPDQVAVFTATYTVTQPDLNAGSIHDSATATGTEPDTNTYTTPTPGTATVTATAEPGLTIAKSVSPASVSAAGQVITSTFTVTNTGNVTLSSVGVTDTQTHGTGTLATPDCTTLTTPSGSCSGATTSLAPDQVGIFTTTYTVTQPDIDNGANLTDSATATGTEPSTNTYTTPTPGLGSVTVTQTPGLTIVKSASPAIVTALNSVIDYTFTVTNTGYVTLSDVYVSDTQSAPAGTLTSGPTCDVLSSPSAACTTGSSTTLAPDQVAVFTATYTVTQPDLNAGSIHDSATATGTEPDTNTYTTPTPGTATVTATAEPGLTIAKSVSPASVSAAGQVITSTFTVTNTGNVTLSSVGVTDTQTHGTGTLATPDCTTLTTPSGSCSGATTSLAPDQVGIFTTTYTVNQADIDNGANLTDSATATGTEPSTNTYTTPTPGLGSVTVTQTPSLTIVKSASPAIVTALNSVIDYTFTVTNTGYVTLSDVYVSDTQSAPAGTLTSGPTCDVLSSPSAACTTGSSTTLAPDQVAVFTATYTVTQPDLNAGSIHDSATATGTEPDTNTYTTPTPGTATVTATAEPGLTIAKSVSPASVSAAGQVITSTFTVTNTGNVTLSSVGVTDTQTHGTGTLATPDCTTLTTPSGSCSGATTSLAPDQVGIFTTTYTVTQADIDNGANLTDSATATGTEPSTNTYTTPTPGLGSVTVTQTPGLTIVKSASPAIVTALNSVIDYTFTVTNTGYVTLSDVYVSDTQSAPAGTLTSGPTCDVLSSPSAACTTGSSTTLAPDQVAVFTATYTVTQPDLNAGSIHDSATATGTEPDTNTYTTPTPGTATVTATAEPGLTIAKSVSPASVSAAGQVITSTFTVTNTGNVTLSSVGVTDTQTHGTGTLATPDCTTLTTPSGSCSGATTSLAPDQVGIFTTTYTVNQADIDNGANLTDSATATGTEPSTNTYTTPTPGLGSVTVTQTPGLTIAKSVSPASVYEAEQVITSTFTVTNTGNVDLTGVYVTDTQTSGTNTPSTPECGSLATPSGSCSGTTTDLSPGQVATFTTTYTVTQADINGGTNLTDSATATGTEPSTNTYTTPTPGLGSVTVTQTPSLTIAKSVSPASVSAAGQVITSTFTVTNTGNVTLSSVGVTDTQTHGTGTLATPDCTTLTTPSGSCSGATTTLAPDQVGIFTTTYTVTQADIDNGANLTDSATATGTEPNDAPFTSPNPGTQSVTVTQTPGLTIAKSVSPASVYEAEQVITSTFTVTNTGNVDLTGVYVTDTQTSGTNTPSTPECGSLATPSGSCSGTTTDLSPGQVATFTATYNVTQADVNNEADLTDSATASGTEPDDSAYATPTPANQSVMVDPVKSLTIVKSANRTDVTTVGQIVTYTFTLTNTGTVPLSSVTVTDTQSANHESLTSGPTCVSLSSPSGTCSGSSTTLQPGQAAIFTATYTVTLFDINNGFVSDSASAMGEPPTGPAITTTTPSTVTIPVLEVASLAIITTAGIAYYSKAGTLIPYTFLVVNVGKVSLVHVTIDSSLKGLSTIKCPATTLNPGASMVCSAHYKTTGANLKSGEVVNEALAIGKTPSGKRIRSELSGVVVPAINKQGASVTG